MADLLRRSEGPDGTWLEAPPRTASAATAWGMAAFGVVVTGFMVFWMTGASGGWRYRGPGDLIAIAFGLLGLPGLGFGLLMVMAGIGLRRGWSRCSVCVGRDRVQVREQLGVLRWTRSVPRSEVVGFLLGDPAQPQPQRPLLLRRRGRGDLRCATGCPAEVQQQLLDGLNGLLGGGIRADRVPPPGNLLVEESRGRLAIALRQPGGWRGLAVFALVWLGFVGGFTALALGLVGGRPASWGMVAATLPFWAVGAGMACLCVHLATRRSSLLWDGAMLTQIETSALRRRIRTWSARQLGDILVEERGSGSGRYQVVALRQHDGSIHDLGQGLDGEALAWIADRLRRELASG